jgi:hypothetical protein
LAWANGDFARNAVTEIWNWLANLEWNRLIPEILGKAAGFLLGFAASWFLLFRKKLQELRRLHEGDSDEILFQMHKLVPIASSQDVLLIFRNVGPKTSINQLYENVAARELLHQLVERTELAQPILQTEGTPGFEILNDALGYIAGFLSVTPFERENWLFMMTCEDRQVVRKRCIRCFLVRPDDLERFADWQWCLSRVQVEKPWHAYRIMALYRIAQRWKEEKHAPDQLGGWKSKPDSGPQPQHNRIRILSVGLHPGEKPTREPVVVNWDDLGALVKSLQPDTAKSAQAADGKPATLGKSGDSKI